MKTQKNFEMKKNIYIEILRITNYCSSIEKTNNELGYHFFFFKIKDFLFQELLNGGRKEVRSFPTTLSPGFLYPFDT